MSSDLIFITINSIDIDILSFLIKHFFLWKVIENKLHLFNFLYDFFLTLPTEYTSHLRFITISPW